MESDNVPSVLDFVVIFGLTFLGIAAVTNPTIAVLITVGVSFVSISGYGPTQLQSLSNAILKPANMLMHKLRDMPMPMPKQLNENGEHESGSTE